jgi:hypothetical protein
MSRFDKAAPMSSIDFKPSPPIDIDTDSQCGNEAESPTA